MSWSEEFEFVAEEQWQAMLAPLPGEAPCGKYLLYETVYSDIREARREDDPSLSQGDWKISRKRADWKEVEKLCRKALTEESKDLQIAAWLTEAWTHLHGLKGLRAGSQLLLELCEGLWDEIFPPLEEEDPEQRLSPFIWINDKFYQPLGAVMISSPDAGDSEAYSLVQREDAWRILPDTQEEREADDQDLPTRSRVKTSIALTPVSFYEAMSGDLKAIQVTFKTLGESLDAMFGKDAPTFGKLEKSLSVFDQIQQQATGHLSGETQEDEHAESDGIAAQEYRSGAEESPTTGPALVIQSRKDAYRCLAQAAEYLLRTEPHSPTPYLVKRAVSWGELSLAELLLELVNDQHDLATIYQLLGIRPPRGEE